MEGFACERTPSLSGFVANIIYKYFDRVNSETEEGSYRIFIG